MEKETRIVVDIEIRNLIKMEAIKNKMKMYEFVEYMVKDYIEKTNKQNEEK